VRDRDRCGCSVQRKKNCVQRTEFVELQALVHEMYWHKLDSPKATVDTPDELVHRRAQVLILLDILTRRHGKLYKDNPADPLGMLCEEKLESVELLRHALDIVESVDTNDNLDAVKALFERSDALLDGLFLQVL
jgi:hypothetical protein